ncbi:MAG: FG-GAP-like repeat-containing protein [Planctomycetaceae bacterium]|nr:FG-GAP-like repeat-containing protein [Planctomycetaceae bacterium]
MRCTSLSSFLIGTGATALLAGSASAQWLNYVNETSTRLSAASGLVVNDNLEKDFAWGDFDQDGDTDLICMRKFPGSIQGGFRDILFMNQGGVLVDRTADYGTSSDVAGSQGMLDSVNDRDVKAVDVDNDGWLDLVTATTMSDHVSTVLGQPRVYRNLGNNGSGQWQGFRFEDARIPTMVALTGSAANPRFCELAVGDFTGDGFVDLFYTDYDTPETSGTICIDLNADGDTSDAGECQQSPGETASLDYNNKFLVNLGAANPGHFVDTVNTRMTATQLASAFGNATLAADMNGDGKLDVVRVNTLTGGQDVATIYSKTDGLGNSFDGPDQATAGAPYNIASGDLNNDGRLDLVVVDDGQDKILINAGNGTDGFANFTSYTIAASPSEFGNAVSVVDLDNDGLKDVIICDVDADLGPFCPSSGRTTKIYRNTGVVGGSMLSNQSSIIPTANISSVFDIAAFDIDGNGWKDMVIGRCGGIDVFMNRPPLSLSFSYPSGRPATLNPDGTNSFAVNVTIQGGGSVVAGTAKLYVSTNGGSSYTSTALTPTGSASYLATFPDVDCGDVVRYYVGATLSNGGPTFDPATAPSAFFTAPVQTGSATIAAESFEGAATGWAPATEGATTGGQWVLGVPVGTASGGSAASPSADATPGSGTRCFMTGLGVAGGTAGSQDLDGGPATLTSPTYDLSAVTGAQVSMAIWFFCDDILTTPTQADKMRVEVSNGGPWVLMEEITTNQQWANRTYNLGSFVTLNSTVRVRLFVNDTPNDSVTEAGLDEFVLSASECVSAPACPADLNSDGTVDAGDLATMLSAWGGAKYDLDGDGTVGASDLATMLSSWGTCP